MIRHVLNREVIQKIRAAVDQPSQEPDRDSLTTKSTASLQEPGSHVKLGSPDRSQEMLYFLQMLVERHKAGRKHITNKLQRYLYKVVPNLQLDDGIGQSEPRLPDISGLSVRFISS
jgi:hypothetical protein